MYSFDWDPGDMMDGYDNGGMMNDGGAWLMVVVALLLLALIGTVIFWAIRAAGPPAPAGPSPAPPAPSPRDLLDLRLARGEVTPEEYNAIRPLLDR